MGILYLKSDQGHVVWMRKNKCYLCWQGPLHISQRHKVIVHSATQTNFLLDPEDLTIPPEYLHTCNTLNP